MTNLHPLAQCLITWYSRHTVRHRFHYLSPSPIPAKSSPSSDAYLRHPNHLHQNSECSAWGLTSSQSLATLSVTVDLSAGPPGSSTYPRLSRWTTSCPLPHEIVSFLLSIALMKSSPGPPKILSWPARLKKPSSTGLALLSPKRKSAPAPPLRMSFPAQPSRESRPRAPSTVSSPLPAHKLSSTSECAGAPWRFLSSRGVPSMHQMIFSPNFGMGSGQSPGRPGSVQGGP